MTVFIYADVEGLVKAWLSTTDVAPLVTRPDGGQSIYMAMPAAAPIPAVVLTRVGGGPRPRSTVPEDAARMQFNCWGKTRAQAGEISRTLMSALESLAPNGGFVSGDARLAAAEVLSVLWLPDPESDTARYIVDARITTVRST